MSKLEEAKDILNQLKVPQKQQSDLCGYVILAMADIKKDDKWVNATNKWIRIHDVIRYSREFYEVSYAENSRETFRKQAMHHFRNAAFIEDNGKATNSPNYRYRLTDEMLSVVKSYQSVKWENERDNFLNSHNNLIDIYRSKKAMQKMPVKINGSDFVGDTIQKDLVKNEERLKELGFEITLHDKMPDVVLYSEDKHWIYFIESVTSVGAMEPKRIKEIKEMTQQVSAGKIYVTAFLDFKTFKKFSESLAWETEVWIADMPEHMIHLNGDRFLGPRK